MPIGPTNVEDPLLLYSQYLFKAVAKIFRVSGDPNDPSSTISVSLFFGCGLTNFNYAYNYGSIVA